MNEQQAYLHNYLKEDSAMLFLDRDGVINTPIVGDYVKHPDAFTLLPGALEALALFRRRFDRIVIVTNQQGVDRALMSSKDLEDVHLKLYNEMRKAGVPWFDAVFYAPYLRTAEHSWRKPAIGMTEQAKRYFPECRKFVVCGDSPGDMGLARNTNAFAVHIQNPQFEVSDFDLSFPALIDFAHFITQI